MDCKIETKNPKMILDIDTIPGDKSISHRSIILSALSTGEVKIHNFLCSEDCLNTARIFHQLGVHLSIDEHHKSVIVNGVGLKGLQSPKSRLDVGNSGTGIRLISGILAAQAFDSEISGDDSIERRPMGRISEPLKKMGAQIAGQLIDGKNGIFPPLFIKGASELKPITYELPVASAQVKSCVLLAGLYVNGKTTVIEPEQCRDHTERMLNHFGAPITVEGSAIHLSQTTELRCRDGEILVPSDISSAAFYIILGLLMPGAELRIKNIGLNPTRNRLLELLQSMGADISLENDRTDYFEPFGDLVVRASKLKKATIPQHMIPIIIDEIPILAIAGLFAEDGFEVRGAAELRVKESDRITSIVQMIRAMGGVITEYDDGFRIEPDPTFSDFEVNSYGDHRIAMSSIIGAIVTGKRAVIKNCDCINTSFPNFFNILNSLKVGYQLQ